MALKVRRTFSDWAHIMDLQIALPMSPLGSEGSRRPYLFATSGRQPYGAITELRKGLDATIMMEADIAQTDKLTGSYGLWALPDPFDRGIHFVITYPGATTAWLLNLEDELEPSNINAAPEYDTLLATITPNNLVIQVTEKALLISLWSFGQGAPSPLHVPDIPPSSSIVAADFNEEAYALLAAVRSNDRIYLDLYAIPVTLVPSAVIRVGVPLALDADLTCLSVFRHQGSLFAVVALRDGMLHLFAIDLGSGVFHLTSFSIGQTESTQMLPVAQSVLVLSDPNHEVAQSSQLIACGLRNGDLFTVEISFGDQSGDTKPRMSILERIQRSC
jgi:hypothetical protein